MSTRYIVTGINGKNERVNIFDDGRSYKHKRYAKSICEQMETVFDWSAKLEVEPIEVLTEAEKLQKELDEKNKDFGKAVKQYLIDNLKIDTRTERPSYGMNASVTVSLTLEGEKISETYLDLP